MTCSSTSLPPKPSVPSGTRVMPRPTPSPGAADCAPAPSRARNQPRSAGET
jgi:hypothetical protein